MSLPCHCFQVLTTLQKSGRSVPAQAMQYGLMSTTLTGLLNPVIYAVFSPTYRRGYGSSVCAVSRFLFGCPLSRSQIIRGVFVHVVINLRRNGLVYNHNNNKNTITPLFLIRKKSKVYIHKCELNYKFTRNCCLGNYKI